MVGIALSSLQLAKHVPFSSDFTPEIDRGGMKDENLKSGKRVEQVRGRMDS